MKRIALLAMAIVLIPSSIFCEEKSQSNKNPFSLLQSIVMGRNYTKHQANCQEIEDSCKRGEISKADYLKLKLDADRNYDIEKESSSIDIKSRR